MEIIYFNKLKSTQKYLIEAIQSKKLKAPIAIITKEQLSGIGSRNNSWITKKGDLIFSFAISKNDLPSDLPLSSASIYFGFLIKEILYKIDSNIFLKWPNDLYIKDKKLGGIITYFTKDTFIVGIGINLTKKDDNFAYIKLKNPQKMILEPYFLLLKKTPSWQEVFNKFRVEFKKSFFFEVNTTNGKKSLKDAFLLKDGSIIINNERIYSLR